MSDTERPDLTVADDEELEVSDEEIDIEAPEADAVEQRQELADEGPEPEAAPTTYEADEVDRSDQGVVVAFDEDEYR